VSISRRRIPFFFLLFVSFLASATEALPAEALISRMHTAFDTLNFELALIRVQDQRIEPLRFTHGVVDGLEISHLVYLNGSPREVVQRGSLFSYFEVDQTPYTVRAQRLPGALAALADGDIDRLLGSYRLLKVGRGRVAGRPAEVVRIVPMDESRYGFLLWLDSESHLPLRLDTLDRDGDLMEQQMVVSVLVYAEPSPWLRELSRVELPAVVEGVNDGIVPRWQLQWMPQGFRLEKASRHRLAITNAPVDHLLLSDGIVSVSVYISDPHGAAAMPSLRGTQGSTSMATYQMGDREVAVVGEIPMDTAQRMARAVSPATDSQQQTNTTLPEAEQP